MWKDEGMRRRHTESDLRQENDRLRQESAALNREIENLVEASAITRATYDQRFRIVAFGSSRIPVRTLCRRLRVHRSGYYAWQARCGQYKRKPRIPERA